MLNPKKEIEDIIGSKTAFTFSEVSSVAQALNLITDNGRWEVAVQRFAYTGNTHLSLFLNSADTNPVCRFLAMSSGIVKENNVSFSIKDFAANSGVEKQLFRN